MSFNRKWKTRLFTVVYFDQLSGAVHNQKLVRILFLDRFNFFVDLKLFLWFHFWNTKTCLQQPHQPQQQHQQQLQSTSRKRQNLDPIGGSQKGSKLSVDPRTVFPQTAQLTLRANFFSIFATPWGGTWNLSFSVDFLLKRE